MSKGFCGRKLFIGTLPGGSVDDPAGVGPRYLGIKETRKIDDRKPPRIVPRGLNGGHGIDFLSTALVFQGQRSLFLKSAHLFLSKSFLSNQFTAIGRIMEPVPPLFFKGSTTNMNS